MLPLVLYCLFFFFLIPSFICFCILSCYHPSTLSVSRKEGMWFPLAIDWQASGSSLNYDQCHRNTLHLWYAQCSPSDCLGARVMCCRKEHTSGYRLELICWSRDTCFCSQHPFIWNACYFAACKYSHLSVQHIYWFILDFPLQFQD